jgi:ubiquinone/menaquinone biosynthesis C-methylase UbiE
MSDLLRRRGVATAAYDFNPHLADGELHPLEKYPHIEALYGDDGVRLPYADESFDAALSCGVLEHVENPGGSLDELRRVLKAGGTLYVYKLPNRASWTEWVARRLGGRLFFTTGWHPTIISTTWARHESFWSGTAFM